MERIAFLGHLLKNFIGWQTDLKRTPSVLFPMKLMRLKGHNSEEVGNDT